MIEIIDCFLIGILVGVILGVFLCVGVIRRERRGGMLELSTPQARRALDRRKPW